MFFMQQRPYNIPGATFVLMQGDSILHKKGYGVGNIETQKRVKAESSIFHVASVSKTFVGTAIMQLYEQGKLKLDVDVSQYLKDFKLENNYEKPITVFDLLTHTAGIDERNGYSCVRTEGELVPLSEHLKERMPQPIREAGEVLTYSNYSYALLAYIVEGISGLLFYEYVQQNILKLLQMHNSGFKRKHEEGKDYVISYRQMGNELIPYKLDFQLYYPAGGFITTADDMGRYISMFLNYGKYGDVRILDSTTVVKMFTTGFQHFESAELKWLLGFSKSEWRGLDVIGHGGDILGYVAEFVFIPEKKIGLYIGINASRIPGSITREFISNFIDSLWGRLLPEIEDGKDFVPGSISVGKVDAPLNEFAGTYRFTRNAESTIEKMGALAGMAQELNLKIKGDTFEVVEWDYQLIPTSGLIFTSPKYGSQVAFKKK